MRTIAMGSAELMDGFSLLGVETFPDAKPEDLETLLNGLLRARDRALIFVENYLTKDGIAVLDEIRKEGGDILITEIPSLDSPGDYQSPVDHLITRVLGQSAL
ncbi:MAG: hypothetical protein ISR69_01455 [Gammaproteobacteria bacterium]|nr:hypothetical protein [Gammaproteobacteria bacterium]